MATPEDSDYLSGQHEKKILRGVGFFRNELHRLLLSNPSVTLTALSIAP